MEKLMMMSSILVAGFALAACSNMHEKRAEKGIATYYEALMNEDYESAFNQLYLYDENLTDAESSVSRKDAQALYLEKIDLLQKQKYRVIGYEIKEVEYEDGHSFWHHLSIDAEQNGETFNWEETAFYEDGKIKVSGDDPFIDYRNGRMQIPASHN